MTARSSSRKGNHRGFASPVGKDKGAAGEVQYGWRLTWVANRFCVDGCRDETGNHPDNVYNDMLSKHPKDILND